MYSIPLYRAADLRRIEAATADQPLMQRAGLAAAELAMTIDAGGGAILILAGPGNNGGDAFEAAGQLRERFFDICVVFVDQADMLPMDALDAYQRFIDAGGKTSAHVPDDLRWSLIIDGLFGIGLKREIVEPYAALIRQSNALSARDRCPLLALDCPSGLDADTGKLHGVTIRASHTISFISGKAGLYTADGPDFCGEIAIAALDLEPERIIKASGHTVGRDLFANHLKPRAHNSHKGSFGRAGVIGGAPGMVGATLLAARAALRLGSGLVHAGLLDENAPAFDAQQPELMLCSPERLLTSEHSALACGPGLGNSTAAHMWLEEACQYDRPLVLDADALNLVAGDAELRAVLTARTAPTLFTPHPAEAARLLDCDVATIQANRLNAACELATRYKACIALKGCGTIIAAPSGQWFVNTSGNPGLATAGSGDVLTGIVTALLAQGWPALEALLAGVHLHGCAADRLVEQGCGPIGLTAGELIDSARRCFNEWIASRGEYSRTYS